MQSSPMRGVYPILVTPFDEDSRIDEESLRRLIEFNLDAGVHGLGVALGSENSSGSKLFEPTLYLYDNYPGGIGQSEPLVRLREVLLAKSRALLSSCPCEKWWLGTVSQFRLRMRP